MNNRMYPFYRQHVAINDTFSSRFGYTKICREFIETRIFALNLITYFSK